ncbi:MAG: hypothetical protein JWM98_1814 [Thermoleophilia bacterium]|nr:hypothetical protein [Thermoleophilia bacterium]
MDPLAVKHIRRDPDALIAYAVALTVVIFALAAPPWLWDRTLDRIAVVAGAIGLPALVTIGRYLLRKEAVAGRGAVMAADARRSGLLEAVREAAPTTVVNTTPLFGGPPRGVTPLPPREEGAVRGDWLGIVAIAAVMVVIVDGVLLALGVFS